MGILNKMQNQNGSSTAKDLLHYTFKDNLVQNIHKVSAVCYIIINID